VFDELPGFCSKVILYVLIVLNTETCDASLDMGFTMLKVFMFALGEDAGH
jgi:hypothetical protein